MTISEKDMPGRIINVGVKAWLQDLAPDEHQRIYRVVSF